MVAVALPITMICADERGIVYIAGTTMKVAQIAVETHSLGYNPADIQASHPYLTLAQIHAALSYYYAHQGEIDAYIAEQDRLVESLKVSHIPHITRTELEARRQRGETALS